MFSRKGKQAYLLGSITMLYARDAKLDVRMATSKELERSPAPAKV